MPMSLRELRLGEIALRPELSHLFTEIHERLLAELCRRF